MTIKAIDVDAKKWDKFRKKCVVNDTTLKAKLDEMITKFLEEE